MVSLSEFIEANTINIQQQSRFSGGTVRTEFPSQKGKDTWLELDYFFDLTP